MRIVKWIVIVVAVLAGLLFGGALFLPSSFSVERSVEIAAPADKVYALLEDPRQWPRWTVWNRRDPAMTTTFSGPPSGAGAGWAWRSASEGNGSMRFTAAEPGQRLAYELSFEGFDRPSTGALQLTPTGSGTRLVWSMNGSTGDNLPARWFGLMADRLIGPDFAAGLANLKALAEVP